jgi:hypothetical protein
MEWTMDRFIRRENVTRFRELLEQARDETERQRLQKLLDEERQKQMEAGDLDDLERQIK